MAMNASGSVPIKNEALKGGTTHVSFVCQRCAQPLKLDHSISTLDQRTARDLLDPLLPVTIPTSQTVSEHDEGSSVTPTPNTRSSSDMYDSSTSPDKQSSSLTTSCNEQSAKEDKDLLIDTPLTQKTVPASRLVSSVASSNDFMLLGEPEPPHKLHLSTRLRVASHLFDVLSEQSDIDHPLCEECTDIMLDQLDQQLSMTENECRDYRDFLEQLEEAKDDFDEAALTDELKKLDMESGALTYQLTNIETERLHVLSQIEEEKQRAVNIEQERNKLWNEYNEYKRQVQDYEDTDKSVDNQLRYAQAQLDKLKRTNVFNATFHIWHEGHFGTINGFRLGRLPSEAVEWNEINAAWGQAALLLHCLAKKIEIKFLRYRLIPFGNHSYLESLTDSNKSLPLHGSGGFRFFWDTKFDQAMVAYLDCLQQFNEAVKAMDPSFNIPYRIDKGKLEDSKIQLSVKIQLNSEEQWTKALKYMLTDLKWGLAWVSARIKNSDVD